MLSGVIADTADPRFDSSSICSLRDIGVSFVANSERIDHGRAALGSSSEMAGVAGVCGVPPLGGMPDAPESC